MTNNKKEERDFNEWWKQYAKAVKVSDFLDKYSLDQGKIKNISREGFRAGIAHARKEHEEMRKDFKSLIEDVCFNGTSNDFWLKCEEMQKKWGLNE